MNRLSSWVMTGAALLVFPSISRAQFEIDLGSTGGLPEHVVVGNRTSRDVVLDVSVLRKSYNGWAKFRLEYGTVQENLTIDGGPAIFPTRTLRGNGDLHLTTGDDHTDRGTGSLDYKINVRSIGGAISPFSLNHLKSWQGNEEGGAVENIFDAVDYGMIVLVKVRSDVLDWTQVGVEMNKQEINPLRENTIPGGSSGFFLFDMPRGSAVKVRVSDGGRISDKGIAKVTVYQVMP